jgi:hypothetical protein
MTTPSRPHREIDGKGRTIRELLAGRKYSIDYPRSVPDEGPGPHYEGTGR